MKWINVVSGCWEGRKVLIRISCNNHFNVESGEYKGDGLWLGCWCDTYGKKGSAYQVAHWMPYLHHQANSS